MPTYTDSSPRRVTLRTSIIMMVGARLSRGELYDWTLLGTLGDEGRDRVVKDVEGRIANFGKCPGVTLLSSEKRSTLAPIRNAFRRGQKTLLARMRWRLALIEFLISISSPVYRGLVLALVISDVRERLDATPPKCPVQDRELLDWFSGIVATQHTRCGDLTIYLEDDALLLGAANTDLEGC